MQLNLHYAGTLYLAAKNQSPVRTKFWKRSVSETSFQ